MTQRKAIRHAMRDLLKTIADMSTRVHASRSLPVNADKAGALPCILVYTDRDESDKPDDYVRKRNLALRIVVITRNNDGADDELDELCDAVERKVEQAMSGELPAEVQPAICALIDSCDHTATALTYSGEEGRAEFVHAEMSFAAVYYRKPAQLFEDLNEVAAEFDMSSPRNDPQDQTGPDGQTDAAVRIELNP